MIFLLSKAFQKGHFLIKKRLAPYGLTNRQYVVLETIFHLEGLTAVELSTILAMDKATLSGVLERMAESGFIEKRPDENDRRAIRIYLTEKSKNLRAPLLNQREAANEELLSGFKIEEKVLLRRFLMDMIG
jgi:DNA-binding MarR family transcriptional regulator